MIGAHPQTCGMQPVRPLAPPDTVPHDPGMHIREAGVEDAVEACHVLRRSITELCTADHRNDPAVLEGWLANKTPENVVAWIAHPGSHVFVATEAGTILAVGAIKSSGEITLNYVSPDARFRGVSRALLERLEDTARALGNERCTLTSTETARRFYQSAGYREDGPPESSFGAGLSYPMVKRLVAPSGRAATSSES